MISPLLRYRLIWKISFFPLRWSRFDSFPSHVFFTGSVSFPSCKKDDIDLLSLPDEKPRAFPTKPESKLASCLQTAPSDPWHWISTSRHMRMYARRLWTITQIEVHIGRQLWVSFRTVCVLGELNLSSQQGPQGACKGVLVPVLRNHVIKTVNDAWHLMVQSNFILVLLQGLKAGWSLKSFGSKAKKSTVTTYAK